MKDLRSGYLFKGKNTYEMWEILKTLLDKFKKQFISMKKWEISGWIGKLKDLLETLKKHTTFQK